LEAFIITEDQAIVELAVDIPFGIRGRETRLVPVEWAKRVAEEFRSLGSPAPDGLQPLPADFTIPEESEFRDDYRSEPPVPAV
jgi:hypothetical protein